MQHARRRDTETGRVLDMMFGCVGRQILAARNAIQSIQNKTQF